MATRLDSLIAGSWNDCQTTTDNRSSGWAWYILSVLFPGISADFHQTKPTTSPCFFLKRIVLRKVTRPRRIPRPRANHVFVRVGVLDMTGLFLLRTHVLNSQHYIIHKTFPLSK